MKFRTILADPPWDYRNSGRGSEKNHYRTLSTDDLCALPVADVCQESAALLLWYTWPTLPDALRVVEAWGFRYVTGFPWVKMDLRGAVDMGLGFHVRACSEPGMIALRGPGPHAPAEGDRQRGLLLNPRGRHSAKPEAQYDFAEAYPGPYLEMFARPRDGMFPPRPGWVQIGNEATGRDIREDLRILAEGEAAE